MKKALSGTALVLAIGLSLGTAALPSVAEAQEDPLPTYLRDRGTGIPTSQFGTYIRKGELLIYPFFEYYRDKDAEYKPAELGFGLDEDFRGRYRATEGLLFLSYGFTDWLAVELEGAVIDATLETSPDDPSGVPEKISESGLGDVEGQLRLRWARESERRPEVFSYFEAVAPLQKDKVLIGTSDWQLKLGAGLIKGFSWGTMTFRASAEYSAEESKVDVGEFAVEYLKRLSPAWRVFLGVEGTSDEFSLITEAQWHISESVFLKVNNGLGITSKATDWAPEIGVVFAFPRRKK